ncbi:DUF1161 domain-containing protein [Methylibium petroleiphilum]|uniref:DUF1161 domain-containing protein n=1 Tax=Methylibium petroleiphilum TaxID=105560 RepID=UPI001AC10F62|nr:DUF1161 domain-containing protein [Methylibium petroleiphilum]MBN9205717.1 DUF1161 domain-containing protein [Methylibium petroleiphilum]
MRILKLSFSLCAVAAAWLCGVTSAAGAAQSCEQLRERIDAKVRASGATHYTVTTVDADAAVGASAKVVGSCELGTKKIVYTRGEEGTVAAAPALPVTARPRGEPLLTECKDGSVSVGGDCRK